MNVVLRKVSEETRQHYRPRAHEKVMVKLPTFWVLIDGVRVGTVQRVMVSHERRARGARYVYARWSSPGWRYSSQLGFARGECETRIAGIVAVLMAHGPVLTRAEATELARAAKVDR